MFLACFLQKSILIEKKINNFLNPSFAKTYPSKHLSTAGLRAINNVPQAECNKSNPDFHNQRVISIKPI